MIVGSLPYLLLAYFLGTNPAFILDQIEHPLYLAADGRRLGFVADRHDCDLAHGEHKGLRQ